jgi:endonuclease/exonuclease/phosphatase family metal-dependent hydrolase
MKKQTVITLTLIATILMAVILAGCVGNDSSTLEITPITEGDLSTDNTTLRIGAFNIQIFGKSKAGKPEVMDVLAKIIRTYDVVAIQEIRDKDQTALPKLVNLTNTNDSDYLYIVSERLGRTTSKEQYAYIYNSQTVRLNGTPETYPEPNGTDPFHREPYIASFEALNGSFDVTLIVIHTDPDEATEEINALDAVVNYTQNNYPDEQDFIVMGDLNADCSYFDEDLNSTMSASGYYWCINNSIDTTTSATNCTYDRIIITSPAVSDYTGDSGVFRYDIAYNLTEDETRAVSDHYPIYAEFYCNRDIDTLKRGGSLSVSSSPSGTTIYLDGSYKGKTPRTITEVSPGGHTIKLTLGGYYDWSTTVNAKTGEIFYVKATLTPVPPSTPTPTHTLPLIVINEVESNPPGNDNSKSVIEWVELYNPASADMALTGWILKTTHGRIGTVYLSGTIKAKDYRVFGRGSQWLDNEGDLVILRDNGGAKIDEVAFTDNGNDDYTWQRYPNGEDSWDFRWKTKGYSNGG